MAPALPIFEANGNLIKTEDGTYVAKVSVDSVLDVNDNLVFKLERNTIKNRFGTIVAEMKEGKLLGASGHEYATALQARVPFKSAQSLNDLQIAALWLWLVRGMR